MCGIAGIVKFDGKRVEAARVKAMTNVLEHRGPDSEGLFVNELNSIALGHRRLSILDLSEAGKQPFNSEDGRFSLTYNGEIYNYLELRNKLEMLGEKFLTNTDTEVLLKMFITYGESCLNDLEGMFAFAIWDNKKQELFCGRDRFGEKPFFYFQDKNEFVFASEIKALWAAGINRKLNPLKSYEYLLYGTTRDSNNRLTTFYEGINELPASHSLRVHSNGQLKMNTYWDIDLSIVDLDISFEDAAEKFGDMLRESVLKRMRSDVSVGSSLSGGLDSSTIVSLVDSFKSDGQKQKTFSARFKDFEKDEGKFIKEVLQKYPSIEAFEIYPNEQSSFKNLDKIIYHHDEPFNSLSIAAGFEVMEKAAKEGVKVLLDGQGADEYLAGYPVLHKYFLKDLKQQGKPSFKNELKIFEENSNMVYDSDGWKDKISTINSRLYQNLVQFRRKNISLKSPYFMGIHPELVKEYRGNENPIYKSRSFKEQLKQALQGRGLGDLLRYADRNSMANSIEARLPFLDHKLIEFVFSLPNHFLIHKGWTKYLLRKSMENILPEKICWRKDKVGYEPPQKKWMASKDYTDILESSKQKLMDEKVIIKDYDELDWKYIMLASYI